MSWNWAWRDLLRHRGRTLLALLGVAVSAALLLDMTMLSGGIERSFERLLLGRGYQLRITPSGTLPFDTEATLGGVSALVEGLRADAEVDEAGAILGVAVQGIGRSGDAVALVGYGVQPGAQGIYQLESGRDLVPDDGDGILLGAPAARDLGVVIGDTVRVQGRLDPQTATPVFEQSLVVRGMVRFLYDAREQPSAAMSLDIARRMAGPAFSDRASLLMVRVSDDRDPGTVAARLQRQWPAVGVSSVADLVVQFRLRLTYFRQLSLILGVIALVVTVLLVGTLLTITVHERLPEIATLRALGVSRATILWQVLAQGTLLTVGGGILGTGLGLATARWLDTILTSFPGLPASVSFFVAAPEPMLLAGGTLLLTGVLTGLWPGWQAARAPIAETLRQEAT